jgi:hypothetical protein
MLFSRVSKLCSSLVCLNYVLLSCVWTMLFSRVSKPCSSLVCLNHVLLSCVWTMLSSPVSELCYSLVCLNYVLLSCVWTLISLLSCDGDLNDTTSVRALMICSGDPASVCLLRHDDRRVAAPTWRETTFPFFCFSYFNGILFFRKVTVLSGRVKTEEVAWRRFVDYSLGKEDQPNKSWQYLWRCILWLKVLFICGICQRDIIGRNWRSVETYTYWSNDLFFPSERGII